MKEFRTHQRKNASITATFTVREKTIIGAVMDLSEGGAFIEIDDDIEIGEKIELALNYFSISKPVRIRGEVVSKRPDGMGVKFEKLTPEQQNLFSFLYW